MTLNLAYVEAYGTWAQTKDCTGGFSGSCLFLPASPGKQTLWKL